MMDETVLAAEPQRAQKFLGPKSSNRLLSPVILVASGNIKKVWGVFYLHVLCFTFSLSTATLREWGKGIGGLN